MNLLDQSGVTGGVFDPYNVHALFVNIGSLGINGLPGLSGPSVGVGVLTGEVSGISLKSGSESWSGENGYSGGLYGIYVSSPGSLSSSLSKGEIIGSTGITLFDLPVMSVGSSDCLLLSPSLFSLSNSSCSSS